MHLIWKRPDGFQNAEPQDFRRIALSNGTLLWLHKREVEWYPFQISGDWAGQEMTSRLNRLVNLLDAKDDQILRAIEKIQDETPGEAADLVVTTKSLTHWVEGLKDKVKCNTWEVEIVQCALLDLQNRLKSFS